jgi:hypothetical protein
MFLFNLFMGFGLMKAEQSNYKKALSNGALPARWWPPLLFLAAMVLVTSAVPWIYDVD